MDDKNLKQDIEDRLVDEVEEVEEVEEVLEKDAKDEKIEELTNQLKRAVADYRNLERRNIEERSDAIRFANRNLIEALLPAFDTLIMAGKYTNDESVKLTIARIIEILKENGIEKVATDDAKYNADTMEAIEVVEGDSEKVIEEVRPGFTLNGKLIRPAQVKVGGKKKE